MQHKLVMLSVYNSLYIDKQLSMLMELYTLYLYFLPHINYISIAINKLIK